MMPEKYGQSKTMSQRFSISSAVLFVLATGLGLYFAFAAVKGRSGILRRGQLEAETADLMTERQALSEESARMQNLTRRLSDDYLDIDLLDERARAVLGLIRADEAVLR